MIGRSSVGRLSNEGEGGERNELPSPEAPSVPFPLGRLKPTDLEVTVLKGKFFELGRSSVGAF